MEPPVAPGPERLFDSHRLPGAAGLLVSLLLYAPIGLCLLLLRLFLGLHVFLVSCALPDSLPRRFIVRVMCSVLGLFVSQGDPRHRDANARVFIANHVTHFDHNIINLLTSCNTPMLSGNPGFICWSRGFLELGAAGSRAELLQSLKAYSSQGGNSPLLLFPEETATNGRAGLLRFSSWPFSIMDVIQPVALRVQRPLVAVSVADSWWVAELLWTFFVPFTVYQVRWLPPISREAEEPREEFALRVQELLAVELGVVSTRLTAADKAEYVKRLRHNPPTPHPPARSQALGARPRASPNPPSAEDGHVTGLAQRVQEVLPHVPLSAICRDLAQTHCVDTTIANLLEEQVPFTPPAADPEAKAALLGTSTPGLQHSAAPLPAKAPEKLFARSPVERHMSLQERKQALYDSARRKFTQKHKTPQAEGSC